MLGTVMLPGAALAELVLAAGGQPGCPVDGGTGAAGTADPRRRHRGAGAGHRGRAGRGRAAARSRSTPAPARKAEDGPDAVTCHARGCCARRQRRPADTWFPGQWPPAARAGRGRRAVRADGRGRVRVRAGRSRGCGRPGGRHGHLRRGGAAAATAGGDFGIHPALLDAMLHGALLGQQPSSTAELPFFMVRGAPGPARGSIAARVRLASAAEPGRRVDVVDERRRAGRRGGAAGLPPGRPGPARAVRGRPGPAVRARLGWVPEAGSAAGAGWSRFWVSWLCPVSVSRTWPRWRPRWRAGRWCRRLSWSRVRAGMTGTVMWRVLRTRLP